VSTHFFDSITIPAMRSRALLKIRSMNVNILKIVKAEMDAAIDKMTGNLSKGFHAWGIVRWEVSYDV